MSGLQQPQQQEQHCPHRAQDKEAVPATTTTPVIESFRNGNNNPTTTSDTIVTTTDSTTSTGSRDSHTWSVAFTDESTPINPSTTTSNTTSDAMAPGDVDGGMETVAYLGPRSSYSHQAALDCFNPEKFVFRPQVTIADIFQAVQSGNCTYGVVPFENSTNGSVVFTLDLFCDRDKQYPDALVCGEAYLDVHHCLLGHARSPANASSSSSPASPTSPTTPADDLSPATVSRIYSHPQAFGQCERFLTARLKGVERVDVSSTSKAAELASRDPRAVAIASRIAADVHGIRVLAANIEDAPDNTTRFLVLSRRVSSPPSTGSGAGGEAADKTLLSFTIDHLQPGALCDSLKVFKDYGLNLTSIASRPSRIIPWNYIFFVEFRGHRDEEHVKEALTKMGAFCKSLRVLGSYRDRQKKVAR